MKNNEGLRSVHFPSAPAGKVATEPRPEKSVNVLEVFANAHSDIELIRKKLRELLTSETRHGDLQISLSAAKRLIEEMTALIEHEER